MNWSNKKVIVTGGNGFLGSHLVDALKERGCEPFVPSSEEYDLRDRVDIAKMFFMIDGWVDCLFHLAANVGGIGYNRNHPYSLFYDNAIMGLELIDMSIRWDVKKFIQLGTVCAYPKFAPIPFNEKSLWDGYPEHTNAAYGLAKKMLLVQLQAARQEFDFNGIYLLPTNLYGPHDNFNPSKSHVIPALIAKCLEAQEQGKNEIELWGSGNPSRDFLYVKDAVEAIILAAEKYDRPEPLNLGSGKEIKIASLIHHIMNELDFHPKLKWDTSQPDGQPRRALRTQEAKYALGWKATTSLKDGLKETIEWYKKEIEFAIS